MPYTAGRFSSINPGLVSNATAPCASAWACAAGPSATRQPIAQADGPCACANCWKCVYGVALTRKLMRSEEHTSELQSLMRISYAVFCLKKKNKIKKNADKHEAK